ncbi:multifunctional CCA addition/repair protein [Pleionea sediminis]|uniref:multifunctional CCA addition/repair protein n=1 Tax=Pleionea sediminis TaxID=2569479 RepID=UPI001186A4F5|nr:multifunctional CCA addition/repair protein [Pleionea sediminis]
MDIYLVGGSVRDELLNRPVVDRDWVVVGATPEELKKDGYQQVGKDFPVFLHPETKDEYALARTERKTGQGYHGFDCYFAPDVTLEQDLERRDLTINAIAKAEDGTLIDPFNGQKDIEDKVLRHVSDAFVEDPLRVLRVARFAARYASLGFTIADETLKLMQQLAQSGELNTLTPERVWKETEKALLEKSPAVYFEVLHDTHALSCFFPELDRLWGIPNPEKWHPEIDTGIHTMMVLDQAALLSDSIDVRFAALCHDLGKGLTPAEEWPSHKGHEKAGIDVIKSLCERLRVPKKLNQLACLTSEYHLHSHKAFELSPKTIIKFFEKAGAYTHSDRFEHLLLACEADFKGRTGFESRDYPQKTFLSDLREATQDIDTKAIIERGFKGKQVGERIHQERVQKAKHFIKNSKHEN